MWRMWIMGGVLFVGLAAWAQSAIPEGSTGYLDCHFDDGTGVPTLPTTLTGGIHDALSKKWLYGPFPVTPAQNCPTPVPGCTTVTVPAEANVIVGRCAGKTPGPLTYCLTDVECAPNRTCQATQEGMQEHILTVDWDYSGGSGTGRIPFNVQNLENYPFPPTSTPTATYTVTNTATPTRTATITPVPTETP